MAKFADLKGKILKSWKIDPDKAWLILECESGEKYKMFHEQDCCETVWIEDICGDLEDLVGIPILMAEEIHGAHYPALGNPDDSYTWTFYKLAGILGNVTIRWYGSSNGYYSESVSFVKACPNGVFPEYSWDDCEDLY